MTWLFTSTLLFLCGDLKLECPFRLLYSYQTLYKEIKVITIAIGWSWFPSSYPCTKYHILTPVFSDC